MRIIQWDYTRGLGDCLMLCWKACAIESVEGSCAVNPIGWKHQRNNERLVKELLAVLHRGERIEVTTEKSREKFEGPSIPWPVHDLERWRPNQTGVKIITYQFDGVAFANLKNPPGEDVQIFLRECAGLGFKTICLGSHMSIADCVRAMSLSCCFVGIDSGMAHLAYSVGVPVYLARYKQTDYWIETLHRGKAKRILPTLKEVVAGIRNGEIVL